MKKYIVSLILCFCVSSALIADAFDTVRSAASLLSPETTTSGNQVVSNWDNFSLNPVIVDGKSLDGSYLTTKEDGVLVLEEMNFLATDYDSLSQRIVQMKYKPNNYKSSWSGETTITLGKQYNFGSAWAKETTIQADQELLIQIFDPEKDGDVEVARLLMGVKVVSTPKKDPTNFLLADFESDEEQLISQNDYFSISIDFPFDLQIEDFTYSGSISMTGEEAVDKETVIVTDLIRNNQIVGKIEIPNTDDPKMTVYIIEDGEYVLLKDL